MNSPRSCTNTPQALAAIYREAARRVNDGDYGSFCNYWHCPDIAIGTTHPGYRRDDERSAFRDVFDTNVGSFKRLRKAGLLALCFAAAMAEAGDIRIPDSKET